MDKLYFQGYLRANGEAGIRNVILVLHTVNCAAFVAQQACERARDLGIPAQVCGNGSCFDNQTIILRMLRLIAHGNVGGVLIVGHGCEFIQASRLSAYAERIQKPCSVVMDQEIGTEAAIEACVVEIQRLWESVRTLPKQTLPLSALRLGVTAADGRPMPTLQRALDRLSRDWLAAGASLIVDAIDPQHTAQTAGADSHARHAFAAALDKAAHTPGLMRTPDACFAGGFVWSGALKLAQLPPHGGLWYLDAIQDLRPETGYMPASVCDRAVDLICSGAQLVLILLGGGAVVGPIAAPACTICEDPAAAACFPGEIDCVIGDKTGASLSDRLLEIVNGQPTVSEVLGIFEAQLLAVDQH